MRMRFTEEVDSLLDTVNLPTRFASEMTALSRLRGGWLLRPDLFLYDGGEQAAQILEANTRQPA
ncbi:hypothetical protein [Alcanivorax sp.]|uniref:hypothetical protein n=1 Tax=Alcanivorax sp. TaxID=1872427 RepID=UPI0025C6D43A|nr:hypothetical protein [Alcanivorax sp.]